MRFFGRLRLTYPTHVACTCHVPPSHTHTHTHTHTPTLLLFRPSIFPLSPHLHVSGRFQRARVICHRSKEYERVRGHDDIPSSSCVKNRAPFVPATQISSAISSLASTVRRSRYHGDIWRRVAGSTSVHAKHVGYVVPLSGSRDHRQA